VLDLQKMAIHDTVFPDMWDVLQSDQFVDIMKVPSRSKLLCAALTRQVLDLLGGWWWVVAHCTVRTLCAACASHTHGHMFMQT
jgi:hypothetical protein